MSTWPRYPAYDDGPHLEEAAIRRFAGGAVAGWMIHAAPWTPLLNGQPVADGQRALSSGLAFAVCSHDDAPQQAWLDLLPETRWYSAGGRSGLGVPIPLVASSEPPGVPVPRDLLWSFVGSDTHPLRRELIDAASGLAPHVCHLAAWSPHLPIERVQGFADALRRSVYALAPRGYGPTSYRLYEALRTGAVPVYVSDVHWLPYDSEVDWDRLAIVDECPRRAARRMVDELPLVAERRAYAAELRERWTVPGVLDWIEADLRAHPVV